VKQEKIEVPSSAKSVAVGTAWAAIDNWTQQGIQIVAFVVIGNIIGPEVYGVMAIGFVYMLLVNSFIKETFGEAIIQRKDAHRGHFEAAFWVVFGLGVVAAIASFIGAPYVAAVFEDPRLVPVITMLGLVFPVTGTANILQSKLRRDLDFRSLAIRSIIAYGASSAVAIYLALDGYGIWSLIVFQLLIPVLDFLCLAIQGRWLPRIRFSRDDFSDIADFSYKTMGSQIIGTFAMQIDRLLVGYFIGPVALGLYGMARRIVDAIQRTILGVINTVALPAFSKLQDDKEQLCKAVTNASHFASLVAFPAFAGLALVSNWLIVLLLKPEWQSVGAMLPILCFGGFTMSAGLFLTTVKRAVGRAGLVMKLAILTVFLRLGVCAAAIYYGYGVFGVIVTTTALTYLLMPLRLILVKRLIDLKIWEYCKSVIPATVATLFMSACVYGVQVAVADEVPVAAALMAMIVTGAVSYVAALLLVARSSLMLIMATVKR